MTDVKYTVVDNRRNVVVYAGYNRDDALEVFKSGCSFYSKEIETKTGKLYG